MQNLYIIEANLDWAIPNPIYTNILKSKFKRTDYLKLYFKIPLEMCYLYFVNLVRLYKMLIWDFWDLIFYVLRSSKYPCGTIVYMEMRSCSERSVAGPWHWTERIPVPAPSEGCLHGRRGPQHRWQGHCENTPVTTRHPAKLGYPPCEGWGVHDHRVLTRAQSDDGHAACKAVHGDMFCEQRVEYNIHCIRIQRAWRRCVSTPMYLVCRRRLMAEFHTMPPPFWK